MAVGRKVSEEIFWAVITTVAIAAVCYPVRDMIGYQSVGLVFLMSISLLSLFLGRIALLTAALLNFGVWNYFFIQPLYTFQVHSLHDLIALFSNLIVALAASALISRIRKSHKTLQMNQEQLQQLHKFLESLNDSISIKDVVRRVEEGIRHDFDASVILYLKEKSGTSLNSRPYGNKSLHQETIFREMSAVFNRIASPAHTEIGGIDFFPLVKSKNLVGVIGMVYNQKKKRQDHPPFLMACFALVAAALEREMTIDQLKAQEISSESEKLFRTVLNSVSHEIKTPIAIISAAAANLLDPRTSSEPELRRQIAEELDQASSRLGHLAENILDMSRLDSGLLKLNLQVCDVADLIGCVSRELRISGHRLRITAGENLPFISADYNLLKQALANILHNAMAYSPPEGEILVDLVQAGDQLKIVIRDQGPGVPESYLGRLFEKFYRVPGTKTGGTGLGLAISKAIIELHSGTIAVANGPAGGLEVTVLMQINHGEQSEI